LRSFIRKHVADQGEAEDILQDVFYELVEAYRLMKPVEQVTAWLFRVARNRIIDRFRRKKREALRIEPPRLTEEGDSLQLDELLPSPEGGPEAAFIRNALAEELDASLDELPDEQREVFLAQELMGYSFNEIAEQTGEQVTAEAIVTSGKGSALPQHYKTEDICVLQIAGSKRWQLCGPAVVNPVKSMLDQPTPQSAPFFDEVLRAGDFLFLQYPQQLGLQVDVQLAYLVEKKGAAVGFFKLADAAGDGAGKSAFLMTEYLALNQRFWNRRAVNSHKGLVFARTQLVYGPRHHFFACAAFPGDQNGGRARRNHLNQMKNLLHGA